MFEPTDEQIEALARDDFGHDWVFLNKSHREHEAWKMRRKIASPAFQAIIRAAQVQALREAADGFEAEVGLGEFFAQINHPSRLYGERYATEAWEHQGPYMNWLRNRADRIEAADV